MNKLAILAIIAMVLFSANAFRFQSRIRSNVEAKTETRDLCEQSALQCNEQGCHNFCSPEDKPGCLGMVWNPELVP
nr:preproEr-11 [Euplotes raikovi]CAA43481.1 preproEr-10 [Euplotes raikovi]